MEQGVSYIFIYYTGCLKKALQFFMLLEPIYNKNFFLLNKMFIMNTVIRFKQ